MWSFLIWLRRTGLNYRLKEAEDDIARSVERGETESAKRLAVIAAETRLQIAEFEAKNGDKQRGPEHRR